MAFIDAEHAFDPAWAEGCGLNIEDVVVCQPESGEMGLEVVDQLARSSAVDLVVVDSVAALTPRAEIEGEIGLFQVGAHARLMSQALRKIAANAYRSECTIIFLNQLRQKVGVIYGNPEVTTGGNALKFYSSVRLDIRRTEVIKGDGGGTGAARDNTSPGIRVRVKVAKNKVAFPYRVAELDILFESGIDTDGSVLQAAVEHDVVQRKGAWYAYGDVSLGQGKTSAVEHLRGDTELLREIREATIKAAVLSRAPASLVQEAEAEALLDEEDKETDKETSKDEPIAA